jgi:hypothetical protein
LQTTEIITREIWKTSGDFVIELWKLKLPAENFAELPAGSSAVKAFLADVGAEYAFSEDQMEWQETALCTKKTPEMEAKLRG